MSDVTESFQKLLKDAGYSLTKARLTVFTALEGQEPLSMHQLVERARDIDRASVYRAVELFEQLGIVQRLNIGWKYKLELADRFAAHHHHLTCTGCGRTTAIEAARLEIFIEQLARSYGFTPTAHQVELQGMCASCLQADASAIKDDHRF